MNNDEENYSQKQNQKGQQSSKEDEFAIKLSHNGPILNLIDKKKIDITQIPDALKIMENQIKMFINFIDEKEKLSRKNLEQQVFFIS